MNLNNLTLLGSLADFAPHLVSGKETSGDNQNSNLGFRSILDLLSSGKPLNLKALGDYAPASNNKSSAGVSDIPVGKEGSEIVSYLKGLGLSNELIRLALNKLDNHEKLVSVEPTKNLILKDLQSENNNEESSKISDLPLTALSALGIPTYLSETSKASGKLSDTVDNDDNISRSVQNLRQTVQVRSTKSKESVGSSENFVELKKIGIPEKLNSISTEPENASKETAPIQKNRLNTLINDSKINFKAATNPADTISESSSKDNTSKVIGLNPESDKNYGNKELKLKMTDIKSVETQGSKTKPGANTVLDTISKAAETPGKSGDSPARIVFSKSQAPNDVNLNENPTTKSEPANSKNPIDTKSKSDNKSKEGSVPPARIVFSKSQAPNDVSLNENTATKSEPANPKNPIDTKAISDNKSKEGSVSPARIVFSKSQAPNDVSLDANPATKSKPANPKNPIDTKAISDNKSKEGSVPPARIVFSKSQAPNDVSLNKNPATKSEPANPKSTVSVKSNDIIENKGVIHKTGETTGRTAPEITKTSEIGAQRSVYVNEARAESSEINTKADFRSTERIVNNATNFRNDTEDKNSQNSSGKESPANNLSYGGEKSQKNATEVKQEIPTAKIDLDFAEKISSESAKTKSSDVRPTESRATDNSRYFNRIENIRLNSLPKAAADLAKSAEPGSVHTARISLRPESLGTVFVEIELIGSQANLKIKAEKKETAMKIENQIATLKEKLTQNGVKADNIDVRYDRDNSKSGGGFASGGDTERRKDEQIRREYLRSFAGRTDKTSRSQATSGNESLGVKPNSTN